MELLRYQNNYPALGTGTKILAEQATNLLGGIPPALQDFTQAYQNNLFGDYPSRKDFAPSLVFAIVFAILGLAHLSIYLVNMSRHHYFYLSWCWAFYCLMRFIGFVLRIFWGRKVSNADMGIATEVFLIVPSVLLVSFNLILAQRLFTWRHPVGGSRKLFWSVMLSLYAIVSGIVAMTIVASGCPLLYFLLESNYSNYKRVVKASSVLVLLYSLTSVALIGLAYFFKPTRKDENLYTYRPWWIESFSPFYFVRKGAVREAEESFMKRNHNHRYAVRVIAATHHHYNMVEGLSRERGDLKHNYSIVIICITTLFIFIGALLRLIVTFEAKYVKDQGPLCHPIVMYICWGVLEVIINLLYIVGRVDLRFYRPDRLPAKVRAIITAEQTGVQTVNPPSLAPSLNESNEDYFDEEKFDDGDDYDFFRAQSERSSQRSQLEKEAPPYPVHNDNDSEFHF